MSEAVLHPARTALLLCDLQNDFLHEAGAYGRAGQQDPAIAALPARLAPLASAMRAAGYLVIGTHFTLVPGRGGAPMIAPHLARLRPFLAKGDFAPASWGQKTIEALQPLDFEIEKIAYSAFYMSRLEWVLRKNGIETLILAGIVTNGGVTSTARDAHARDFSLIVLEDGCAAFGAKVHAIAIEALRPIARIANIAEILLEIAAASAR